MIRLILFKLMMLLTLTASSQNVTVYTVQLSHMYSTDLNQVRLPSGTLARTTKSGSVILNCKHLFYNPADAISKRDYWRAKGYKDAFVTRAVVNTKTIPRIIGEEPVIVMESYSHPPSPTKAPQSYNQVNPKIDTVRQTTPTSMEASTGNILKNETESYEVTTYGGGLKYYDAILASN